jgi:hypothetical protein
VLFAERWAPIDETNCSLVKEGAPGLAAVVRVVVLVAMDDWINVSVDAATARHPIG